MEFKNINFEVEHSLCILTINRPKALNALNQQTMLELEQAVDLIGKDKTIQAVILTGSGSKAFVAGADITEMKDLSAIEARSWGDLGQKVFNKIENLPQPVIAAINGFALGGGCELAMACDLRLASDKARFGQPEVLLGVTPGFGGTQRLARLIGKATAKELLFTGKQIDAAEAYRLGLVNEVVSPDELMPKAKDLALSMTAVSPIALSLCKAAVNEGLDVDLDTAQAYEREIFGLCFATEDQREGMNAFVEKRKPHFKGK